jgi:hypothetical protein
MVDYSVSISPSTTMLIRDTGSWVEFWFRTGAQTWNNQQQWTYFANNQGAGNLTYRLLRGGDWQKFGEVYVQYDQDVSFTVYDSGINFPTHTFTQHIQRSTVPEPPTLQSVLATSSTAFRVRFVGNNSGGTPVTNWEIGYSQTSSGPIYTIPSDGDDIISGFTEGSRWYFWARGKNAVGWSAWSNRLEANTWQAPRPPGKAIFSNILQTSVDVLYIFAEQTNLTPILEKELRYSTDPNGVLDIHTVTIVGGNIHITAMDPGKMYYFWARARNTVGWSAWSVRSQVLLLAGARVLVGGEWKRAVPYVKDGGVWKVTEPWVKNAGEWKRIIS